MKDTKFYLLTVMCLVYSITKAQNIDATSYEKAITYFECECVKIAEKQNAKNLDCYSIENSAEINKLNLGRHTKDLVKEIRSLKRGDTEIQSKEELISFLTKKLFNEKGNFPRIYAFAHKDKDRKDDIEMLVSDLKTFITKLPEADSGDAQVDVTASGEEDIDSVTTNTIQEATPKTSTLQNHADETKASFFSFQMNLTDIALAILVIVICLLYVEKVKGDLNNELSKLKSKQPNNQDKAYIMMELQGDVRALKSQIRELKDRQPIDSQEIKHEKETREIFLEIPKSVQPEPPVIPPEPLEKILYMPAPNEDGSFDESSSSEIKKPLATLYEFKIHPTNPNKATFTFCSDDNGMKKALSNPRQNLTPVCYEENDAFSGMQRIVQIESGIAQKEGDRWIVTPANKARIKYE